MWGGFHNPFAQVKKRKNGKGRKKKHIWEKFGFGGSEQEESQGNNGWGNQNQGNNNGWGSQENNNGGWGNEGNNNGGWGNEGNNNQGWGNNNGGYNNHIGGQSLFGNNLGGFDWINEQKKRNESETHNINMGDISNIIEQQIVFLEPSPQKKRLEQLKQNGQVFRDERFHPGWNSLSGEWGKVSEWQKIQWAPISECLPGSEIFQGKVQPGDIKQGYLGDCYFLAALAALAQRPDRIFELFLLNEMNDQKYYSVKMLFKGKWMTVDMDEYIPVMYGKPAFTKARENQLWVVLLQKAWAKIYSNYKRIEAGYPEQGLHDLTGAPIKQLYLQHSSFDKERDWKYLLKASELEYSMVSSSQPGSDTTKSFSGVVQGHAYTFLNATYLNFQGNRVRIVQLRNPWGKGQFKGEWSDYDNNWDQVDEDQKQRVGFNPNVDDGIFFMSYDEYCTEFRAMTIAQIDDNASYVYKSHTDPENKGCYFKVKIHKAGNYSFHVDKTPERSYEDKKQSGFRYPLSELEIAAFDGGSVHSKKQQSSRKRTQYYDQDLQPGEYLAYVKIHYDSNYQSAFDVNLAVYAEYPCEVTLASHDQAVIMSGDEGVEWIGEELEGNKQWNDLGGWGCNENNGWGSQNADNEWGQGGNNNNGGGGNDGWGESNNNNGGGGNDGWGGSNNNNGGNNGWGNEGNGGNSNDGW